MKKPIFIQSCASDKYMLWQTEVQLHNFRKYGYTAHYHVLIFLPKRFDNETANKREDWEELNSRYPEAKFFYYEDTENINQKWMTPLGYIPLLRLYCLKKHFALYPELSKEVIFYHDADIIFTKEFPFSSYMDDDICYLSNTRHYLGLEYLDSKIEHCLPDRKEQLIAFDPVAKIANCASITREIIEKNQEGTGGAQYLLKNVDADFWEDCYTACINLKGTFNILLKYFKDSNTSYQGFCSDMWAVLYTLWKRGYTTQCPTDFDFSWGTDVIEKVDKTYIYHNAGISSKIMDMNGEKTVMFYKGNYANNKNTPFTNKEYLEIVSPKYANKVYANEILEIINQQKQ